MIPLSIEVETNIHEIFDIRSKRAKGTFNRVLKAGLIDTALWWHRKYIRWHFTRGAYKRYMAEYPAPKKDRKKQPLVLTGALRRSVTKKRTKSDVSGTASSVTLKMPIGRPGKMTPEALKQATHILMERHGWSWKRASDVAHMGKGYNKEAKELFQRAITAINPGEQKAMNKHLEEYLIEELNKTKVKRKEKKG